MNNLADITNTKEEVAEAADFKAGPREKNGPLEGATTRAEEEVSTRRDRMIRTSSHTMAVLKKGETIRVVTVTGTKAEEEDLILTTEVAEDIRVSKRRTASTDSHQTPTTREEVQDTPIVRTWIETVIEVKEKMREDMTLTKTVRTTRSTHRGTTVKVGVRRPATLGKTLKTREVSTRRTSLRNRCKTCAFPTPPRHPASPTTHIHLAVLSDPVETRMDKGEAEAEVERALSTESPMTNPMIVRTGDPDMEKTTQTPKKASKVGTSETKVALPATTQETIQDTTSIIMRIRRTSREEITSNTEKVVIRRSSTTNKRMSEGTEQDSAFT